MQILGHRGCRGRAKDNSLAALLFAKNNGANGVEIDLRWHVKCRSIVLAHDPVKLENHYLNFDNAFDQLAKFTGEVQLEVKLAPHNSLKNITAMLSDIVNEKKNWRITSFSQVYLATLPKHVQKGLLLDCILRDPVILARKLNCAMIAVRADLATKKLIRQIKKSGLSITIWTENSLTKARHWQRLGVDILITDRPHQMKYYSFNRSIRPKPSSAAVR